MKELIIILQSAEEDIIFGLLRSAEAAHNAVTAILRYDELLPATKIREMLYGFPNLLNGLNEMGW
jgi:hypothetical protein